MAYKRGRIGWLAIKGDMEKAYDRVEWSFLLAVLRQFSFSSHWIQCVHQCISTTSFSILLNGSPYGYFSPSRGLRQGDPLSPFLFVLVSELLSQLLLWEERNGNLNGLKVKPSALSISHLFFANDLLLFAKATSQEVGVINSCLETYMLWSGQMLNRDKSSIHYSRNTPSQIKAQLSAALHLSPLPAKVKHLGLPLVIPRRKSSALSTLQDRILAKLGGWKAKLLSQAGRTTLLSSVASAMPAYGMSSLLFPHS